MSIFNDVNRQLDKALERKRQQQMEGDRNTLLQSVGRDLADVITPAIENAIGKIQEKQVIQVDAPVVHVPAPQVTVQAPPAPQVKVTVPEIKMPKFPPLQWPDGEMEIRGWVQLQGVDLTHPLPVQLRDSEGNPLKLFDNLTQIVSGGGGGNVVVQNNSSQAIPVYITSGASATSAVNVVDSAGNIYNGANPLPVTITSGGTATSASNIVDSGGVAYSGSNPVPITWVSGAGATVGAANIDSSGVQYSGSNPMPVYVASSSTNSVSVVGDTPVGTTNVNTPPVRIGGVVTQTNPTAYSDGQVSNFRTDDLGRQIMRPVQVRDLIQTAYATLSTGTETTLLAGAASTFYDLIYIMGANTSDAAVQVDIRSGTANGVVATMECPANGNGGVALPVPIPQDVAANTWTVDMPDITGTTVYISALFSKEV